MEEINTPFYKALRDIHAVYAYETQKNGGIVPFETEMRVHVIPILARLEDLARAQGWDDCLESYM